MSTELFVSQNVLTIIDRLAKNKAWKQILPPYMVIFVASIMASIFTTWICHFRRKKMICDYYNIRACI